MADRRMMAGAISLALIVAACGSATSSNSPGPASSESMASQPPASVAAQPTDDSSGVEASFLPGGAADLEALLPSSAGGHTFNKASFDGASIGSAGFGFDAGELDPILSANGKTISDVRMAIATPTDVGTTQPTVVIALQVRGLDASALAELAGANAGGDAMTSTTIAGKQVQTFGAGTFAGAVYLKDDVLYEVLFADDATLSDIVSQLP